MAITYTSPGNSNEDHVRFLIGDTFDGGDVSLQDAEITAALSLKSDNILETALFCARSIRGRIAKFSTGRTVNGLSTSRTTTEMDGVIADIRQAMALANGGIGVFGLTTTDVDTIEDDTTFNQPFAKENQWVNKK